MKNICVAIGVLFLSAAAFAQPAKNAVWLIADGMGTGMMGLFMQGVRNTDLAQYPDKRSVLEKFINASVTGMYFNNTYDTIVTDSACSATQMACGVLSRPEYVGVDHNGQSVQTLMERALEEGKAVGVVTDAYVADATPAGFLAHVGGRKQKYDIARQLVRSDAQVVLGGGLRFFTQEENKKLLKEAKKRGWQVVKDRKALSKVKKGRVLGLFARESMPFYMEKDRHPQTPTLKEMTQKAVELLSQNEKGFVLMVEAGKVDWALHDNEAGPAFYEMLNLDETLAYLWDFARQSGDTLLYLNADHETGMPAFHYRHIGQDAAQHKSAQGEMLYGGDTDYVNYPYYQNLLKQTRMLYFVYPEFKKLPEGEQTPARLQEMVDEAMGVHVDLNGEIPSYKALIKKVNDAFGLTWGTGTHSSGMLLGVAYGPGAQDFSGVYHNTDLKKKFEKALSFTAK